MRTSIVAVLYLIWPSLCSQTFSAFACRRVCEMDKDSFLQASIDEPCFRDRHLLYIGLVAVPMMVGYVLGLPAAAFIAVRKLQRRAIRKGKSRWKLKGHKTWGAFYSSFKGYTWW